MGNILDLGVVSNISALYYDLVVLIIEGHLQDIEVAVVEANRVDASALFELKGLQRRGISLSPLG